MLNDFYWSITLCRIIFAIKYGENIKIWDKYTLNYCLCLTLVKKGKWSIKKNIRKLFAMIYLLRQPTSAFLPGKSHGQWSLVGYSPWGHKKLDMTQWLNNDNVLKEKIWRKHNNMLTFVKFGWHLNGLSETIFFCPF